MEKGTKPRKTGIFLTIAAIFAVVSIVSAIMLYLELRQSKKEADTFAELAAMRLPTKESEAAAPTGVPKVPASTPVQAIRTPDPNAPEPDDAVPAQEEPEEEPTAEPEPEPTPLARYLPLYERNHDYFGWLTIPETKVDYPVMHSPDRPLQYLEHDFDGKFAYAGVPFMDGECDRDGNVYLIYGHRMRNGSIFGGLGAYMDKQFWEKQPIIHFDTLYEERTYMVIVAMHARVLESGEQNGFRYYNYTSLDTEEDFDEYMRQAHKLAMYDTGLTASYGDELLVLSTCDNFTQDGRLVIIAKRIMD